MKYRFLLACLFPLSCFSQPQKPIDLWMGVGFVFYPGSSADVKLFSPNGKNVLKSGLTAELTVDKPVGDVLHLGLGASFFSFNQLDNPYVPVFADIRVIGQGRFRLYSFLDPGYGIFNAHPDAGVAPGSQPLEQKGGFYIGYGFGVIYGIYYLQAKYNWLHFSQQGEDYNDSKSYGIGGISLGIHLP